MRPFHCGDDIVQARDFVTHLVKDPVEDSAHILLLIIAKVGMESTDIGQVGVGLCILTSIFNVHLL